MTAALVSLNGGAPRPLRVAMLAPPWITTPPPGYGGIEAVIDLLCKGLTQRGHAVTLFAPTGSTSSARVHNVLDRPFPNQIGHALYEADHVARSFATIEAEAYRGRPFDVIHDHSGFVALAMADRIAVPMVHTLHGAFDENRAFYAHHASRATFVAISASQMRGAPPQLDGAAVIPNPVDVGQWPLNRGAGDYLLWVGRMTQEKGPHRAAKAALLSGVPLILAGPIQPGQQEFFNREVAPLIDGQRVSYVGEIGGTKKISVFSGAKALLMPITWEEPFGMVMVEAMACGTPVLAFPAGSAAELVTDGLTGFLVQDERAMARAVSRLGEIDAEACRESVDQRFGLGLVCAAYERIYTRARIRRTNILAPHTAEVARRFGVSA